MDDEIAKKKLLHDVQSAIQNIETYIGEQRIFEKYNNSPLIQDAVERNLITIGEAVNSLLDLDSQIKISSARRIVNARNKLTHGYDEIDNTQIWNIIVNHLPVLKQEIEKLLYR